MAKKKRHGTASHKRRKPMTEPELLERLKEVGGRKLAKFAQEVLKEAPDHDLTIVWRDAGPMLKYVHDGGLDQAINFGQLNARGVLRQGKKSGQPAAVVGEYWKMVAQLIPGARLKKFTKPSGQTVESLVFGEKPRRQDWPPLSELAPRKDEWFGVIDAAIEQIRGEACPPTVPGKSGQGRILDYATRVAIELRAMDLAKSHYTKAGYEVADTSSSKPYDLECVKGKVTIRVEVKGTKSQGEKVTLTIGEVRNARQKDIRTDLFVVGHVLVKKTSKGPQASGGKLVHHITNWFPDESDLTPTEYQYRVPQR